MEPSQTVAAKWRQTVSKSTALPSNRIKPDAMLRLVDQLQSGAFWIDSSDRILHWSLAMASLCGMTLDLDRATLEEVFQSVIPSAEERGPVLHAIRRRLNNEEEESIRLEPVSIIGMSGAARWVEFEIVIVPSTEGGGALVLAHNVTQRVNARKDLQVLLRNSSDGIFVINNSGQITLFNDACERITGYKREEILYQSFACRKIFQCENDEVGGAPTDGTPFDVCPGHEVFQGKSVIPAREMKIQTPSGQYRWVDCSYSPIPGPDGKPQYFIGVLRDIGERKRLEEQLRLSQSLATLGELVGGLAHEIRNPLSIIRSSADIVSNPERPAEQRREAAEFIKEEAARLDRTVKALLNLARPSHGANAPQEINAIVERVVSFYAPQRDGFEIDTQYGKNLPQVCACREALETAFLNIILNADQAMDGKGRLTISTDRVGDNARIRFCDTGPGIELETVGKVFQPFYTTKKKGTGLGLSLTLHVIESHKGSIRVENADHGGACFIVELPPCCSEEEGKQA